MVDKFIAELSRIIDPLIIKRRTVHYGNWDDTVQIEIDILCPCGNIERISQIRHLKYYYSDPEGIAEETAAIMKKHISDEVKEGKLGKEWMEYLG